MADSLLGSGGLQDITSFREGLFFRATGFTLASHSVICQSGVIGLGIRCK